MTPLAISASVSLTLMRISEPRFTPAAGRRRTEPAPAEMSAENIAELRENILHREAAAAEAAETASAARRTAHAGMAELAVTARLPAQHVVFAASSNFSACLSPGFLSG